MKFTEGYWLPSEKANASHAMQAYEVEQIPGGMRILATTRPIEHRGMTLNLPTITVEFVAHTPDKHTTTKFRPSTKQRAYTRT